MKLPRQKRPEKGKRRCTPAGGFAARVRTKAQSRLIEVDFAVDGESVGIDRSAPFERGIRARLLRGERKREVTADAELVDGRILTLHDEIRVCR